MEAKVVGMLTDRRAAQHAVDSLIQAGFRPECISIAARQFPKQSGQVSGEEAAGARRGEGVGEREEEPPRSKTPTVATTRGVLDGIGGMVVGLGGVAVPGLGTLIAAGPIAAGIGGPAVGAAGGGLTGSIRDLGLTDEQVKGYMADIKAGAVLVAVHTSENRVRRAADVLRESGARDLHRIGSRDVQRY